MHIVIAPDSYKGSLTSSQAASTMEQAILSLGQNHTIITKPMADGGEGTVDALLTASKGEKIPITCTGPLGEKVDTYYAILNDDTAVMEVAMVAGLPQVPPNKRNPDNTTTYGLGEVLIDALDRGCTSFIIGLGGSATNDAGLGMLRALGMKAFANDGKELGSFGRDLLEAEQVELEGLDPRLKDVTIQVACDVENPLTGEKGASAVYGPQKGATEGQITAYDQAMNKFAKLVDVHGEKFETYAGAGAAGGLGFAFLLIGATLVSGAKLVGEASGVEEAIQQAALVITGEGQSDEQTLYGKAPGYIADLAQKHHVPAILISGALSGNTDPLLDKFAGCYAITNRPLSLNECMEQAKQLLYQQTKQLIHLIHNVKGEC